MIASCDFAFFRKTGRRRNPSRAIGLAYGLYASSGPDGRCPRGRGPARHASRRPSRGPPLRRHDRRARQGQSPCRKSAAPAWGRCETRRYQRAQRTGPPHESGRLRRRGLPRRSKLAGPRRHDRARRFPKRRRRNRSCRVPKAGRSQRRVLDDQSSSACRRTPAAGKCNEREASRHGKRIVRRGQRHVRRVKTAGGIRRSVPAHRGAARSKCEVGARAQLARTIRRGRTRQHIGRENGDRRWNARLDRLRKLNVQLRKRRSDRLGIAHGCAGRPQALAQPIRNDVERCDGF